MKRLPSSRLGAVTTTSRARHSLTPLRALPKDRICEDVYPGGYRSSRAGRIYPSPKVIPFPGLIERNSIAAGVGRALQDIAPAPSLCAMLFFAPPVDHFAAFRGLPKAKEKIT